MTPARHRLPALYVIVPKKGRPQAAPEAWWDKDIALEDCAEWETVATYVPARPSRKRPAAKKPKGKR